MKSMPAFANPYRPGAGHMPPYLAGREPEKREFQKLLEQDTILQNLVLTGLRGVGKTVLLETFKPLALDAGWLWVGTDLSESASLDENSIAVRLLTDLSVATSTLVVKGETRAKIGLGAKKEPFERPLDFQLLHSVYNSTPGLISDKLKQVLELVWQHLGASGKRGIVFAYDEAQNLSDHAAKGQYPMSLLLDVFQSIQRKDIPFMLALTGLPTLFPKLVEARTFSERMFNVVNLDKLGAADTEKAIREPMAKCPIQLSDEAVEAIADLTAGYPYFIQFVCRECYDIWLANAASGKPLAGIPTASLIRKLDSNFFAGRWAKATDRQRDLLGVIATLKTAAAEFTVQEIVERSKAVGEKPFSASHVSQMLATLGDAGLVYKNRWGKYSFAVPLFDQFIRRQSQPLAE